MNDVTYEITPWAKLKLSPLNARYDEAIDTADLEVSIPGAGRMVTPMLSYREGDDVLVWDGGRRLLACQKLIKAKKLPAALKDGAPNLIYASADGARVASLATFVREGMTPAQEFLAAKRLVDDGLSLTEAAAALNLRTARVEQLMRLVRLAPEVLSAFSAGKFPLDIAEAFTLSEDHDRQREMMKAFNPKRDNAHSLRHAFRRGAVDGSGQLATFVGREAYEAAGGKFLLDLFWSSDKEDWLDAELATRLFDEKLADQVRKLEAEGWEWVQAKVGKPYDWDYSKPFDQVPGKKNTFSLEQKATAGAILFVLHNGQMEIARGLVKRAKGPAKPASEAVKKAQEDPAMYGFGHGGHEKMTLVATGAVQFALALNPDAAYDALLSSLAWTAFRENGRSGSNVAGSTYDSNATSLSVGPGFGYQGDDTLGRPALVELHKVWAAPPPHDRVEFCDYVAALPAKKKAELLALSFAWTLFAGEHRTDYRRLTRWAHLGWMARRAGLEIAKAWRPNKEFLMKGSKDALFAAMTEVGMEPEAFRDCKKSLLVEYLIDNVSKTGWVPKLLATLADAPKPKAEPKPAKPKASIVWNGEPLDKTFAETATDPEVTENPDTPPLDAAPEAGED